MVVRVSLLFGRVAFVGCILVGCSSPSGRGMAPTLRKGSTLLIRLRADHPGCRPVPPDIVPLWESWRICQGTTSSALKRCWDDEGYDVFGKVTRGAQIEDRESAVSAMLYYDNWSVVSHHAVSAEDVMERRGAAYAPRRMTANKENMNRLWEAYKRTWSSASITCAGCGAATRIVVRFHTNINNYRWMAFGRYCPLMQTEDHAFHELDGDSFREMLGLLGARSAVESDPVFRKYF